MGAASRSSSSASTDLGAEGTISLGALPALDTDGLVQFRRVVPGES